MRGDARGVAGDGQADLLRADRAARGLDARDPAGLADESRHFAVLNDVDAAVARRARITPDDRVMTRRAAPALQQSALDRKPRIVEIEERQHATHGLPHRPVRHPRRACA